MRVDFLAGFNQVQKLVQTRPQTAEIVPSYKEIEAETKPHSAGQVPETKQQIASLASLPVEESRARFNFSSPGLLLPQLDAKELPSPPPQAVKEGLSSVKTPTGVTGKYVRLQDPFKGLNPEQRSDAVEKIVLEAGQEHGVDPALSMGVIKAESNFNAIAVSNDGHSSKGLMQLLDSTGKDMMSRLGKEDGSYSPFDPEQNVDLGVGYLKRLHDIFSTTTELGGNLKTVPAANSTSLEKLAVAAFNAGEGRVAAAQQRASRAGKDAAEYDQIKLYLPESTREYVDRVMQSRAGFSADVSAEELG